MGAKGKYAQWLEPDNLLKIEAWARDGLNDEEIAAKLTITHTTLYDWKSKFPAFAEALKKGKEVVDIEVENALHRKAMGYNVAVMKHFKIKHTEYNEKGYKCLEYEELVAVEEEIHVPADTTAQIFWLKNRKPAEWRDRKELDHSGNMGIDVTPPADPAAVFAEYSAAITAALASNDATDA